MAKRITNILTIFLIVLSGPMAVLAEESFGDFLDVLKGVFQVNAKPRPVFKLATEFRFRDPNGLLWTTPAGTEIDGASIPQLFWSLIGGPFEGAYINASVIHDHYCRTRERTAHDTHRNFYYGMRASVVPEWKATLMHWAVATFGPSWKLEKRVVMQQTCSSPAFPPGFPLVCTSKPVSKVVAVDFLPVDLSDPAILAAAVSKTNAVARTLLTSNGEVLDVTVSGNVTASLDSVEKSADSYRQAFASKEFTRSPSQLGLLSKPSTAGLGDIQPWADNRIPTIDDAVFLTPRTIPNVERNQPYKLDPRGKDLMYDRVDLKSLESSVNLQNR
jgi:hypothetical protein